jgi:gliding motility-associated protein GldM
MASNKTLTPRQKMINMMYLVLTAILALNVSSEVLNAFKTVNDGIGFSNNSQSANNERMYTQFRKQFAIDSARAKGAYDKAEQAKVLSERLNNLLEQYKKQMIAEAGGIDAETGKIKRDDDLDIATRLFVENNGAKGKKLRTDIEDTRTKLLALLNDADRVEAEKSLSLKIDKPANGNTWEFAKFNQVPVVAAVTLLSKYQNDVLSAEGLVVQKLYSSIYADSDIGIVDHMEARIISPTSYILQGEAYKADVMVAASNSTMQPEVFLGNFTSAVKRGPDGGFLPIEQSTDALPLNNAVAVDVKQGMGHLSMNGAGAGNKKYTGVIRLKTKDGNYKFFPFEGEYQVAPKTAVISPTKMNVLYIGLDNPIDISSPGVPQSNVSASINGGGTLVKNADGSYAARVTQQGTVKITVNAKVDNKQLQMGEQEFRVKRVPDPVSTLDGVYETGRITLSKIKSTRGVVALLKDFPYGTKYTVVSYEISYRSIKDGNITPPKQMHGPLFDTNVQGFLKRMVVGDGLIIDNIIVNGPGGNRKISAMTFDVVK